MSDPGPGRRKLTRDHTKLREAGSAGSRCRVQSWSEDIQPRRGIHGGEGRRTAGAPPGGRTLGGKAATQEVGTSWDPERKGVQGAGLTDVMKANVVSTGTKHRWPGSDL